MCPGHVGPWTAAGVSPNNFGSTGGVVALFNKTLGTLVLSALDNYMTAGLTWSASLNNVFGAGFNGNLDGIPAGWKHQTVLVAGVGVNDTMNAWGDILLAAGGKTRTPIDGDFQTSYLSYWTDNGAYVSARQESGERAWWESSSSLTSPAHPPTHAHPSPSPHSPHPSQYYYNTIPGQNYEQTMLAVQQYWAGLDLPVRAFQFDSCACGGEGSGGDDLCAAASGDMPRPAPRA
jgi:hypothetical protein